MAFRKKDRRDIFTNHYHFFAVQIVAFGNEPAFDGCGVGVHLAEIGLHAAKVDGGDFSGFGAHRV